MILTNKSRNIWVSENFNRYNKLSNIFNLSNDDIKFLDKFESIYNKLHSKEIKEFYNDTPLAHIGRTHKVLYKN